MTSWVSRVDRSYARKLATPTCGTCKGKGEVVVAKDTRLDVYDLGPCYCVRRKLAKLSSDEGIEQLKQLCPRSFRKAG